MIEILTALRDMLRSEAERDLRARARTYGCTLSLSSVGTGSRSWSCVATRDGAVMAIGSSWARSDALRLCVDALEARASGQPRVRREEVTR